jgi:hypothetical protein
VSKAHWGTGGLAIAGIDLKVTRDNRVYCFEVNPSPAYSYYESNTGQPISSAVADYLAGHKRVFVSTSRLMIGLHADDDSGSNERDRQECGN